MLFFSLGRLTVRRVITVESLWEKMAEHSFLFPEPLLRYSVDKFLPAGGSTFEELRAPAVAN